jgi:drug/metabolite transporter (DMT)-like permease
MTRRGAALFALMSVVWGIPYLLIKVAVHDVSPVVVVAARTGVAACILLPLAARQGQVRPLLRRWRPLLVYTVAELAIPWLLLSRAEQHLPSSLSGLLVATVPLITVILAAGSGHWERVDRRGLFGLLIGLVGVGVLLGLDVGGGDVGAVGEVLCVALGYSIGPLVASRYLGELSSLALAAVSLTLVAVAYLPFALTELPARTPSGTALASLIVLGVVCTALAFVAFFELLKEMPPTKATVITYFNPVVAVILGVALLGEQFKVATAVGFVLILSGSWLSNGARRAAPAPAQTPIQP